MSSTAHSFLFSSPSVVTSGGHTSRKTHIARLYDILQLSLHRGDLPRARRAWSILIRCKEVEWKELWKIGVAVLEQEEHSDGKELALLKDMERQYPEQRMTILKERILHMIRAAQYREAIDELELWLSSFPYQDNPVLHIYAGMITLYLSQPSEDERHTHTALNPNLVRDAKAYFDRAITLGPNNAVAQGFLEKISTLMTTPISQRISNSPDSDEEMASVDKHSVSELDSDSLERDRKRIRT